jgi:dienelactone hydrolase
MDAMRTILKEGAMKGFTVKMMVLLLVLGIVGVAYGASKIIGQPVDYTSQGVTFKGYLAFDESIEGKRPGVLVVHEWWGLNEYARKRAQMLAELGYIALAVDMYGDGKTAMHPDDAGKFSSELMKNFDVAKTRFLAAMDFLKQQPMVDQTKIAAIGYCFGGGVVLNMARQGADLKGVASFHGSLAAVSPAKIGIVKAKILVLHGADDTFVKPEQIENFKKEMSEAKVDFQFISYPGAVHSFTSPEADGLGKKFSMPIAYNANADKQSWDELKMFLKKIFEK